MYESLCVMMVAIALCWFWLLSSLVLSSCKLHTNSNHVWSFKWIYAGKKGKGKCSMLPGVSSCRHEISAEGDRNVSFPQHFLTSTFWEWCALTTQKVFNEPQKQINTNPSQTTSPGGLINYWGLVLAVAPWRSLLAVPAWDNNKIKSSQRPTVTL